MIFLIYIYLLFGIYKINDLSRVYIIILAFMSFKIMINYRTCSLSYIECKLRNIKKEEGHINQFFDSIIDVRYTYHIYPILFISSLILYYDLHILQKYKIFKHILNQKK